MATTPSITPVLSSHPLNHQLGGGGGGIGSASTMLGGGGGIRPPISETNSATSITTPASTAASSQPGRGGVRPAAPATTLASATKLGVQLGCNKSAASIITGLQVATSEAPKSAPVYTFGSTQGDTPFSFSSSVSSSPFTIDIQSKPQPGKAPAMSSTLTSSQLGAQRTAADEKNRPNLMGPSPLTSMPFPFNIPQPPFSMAYQGTAAAVTSSNVAAVSQTTAQSLLSSLGTAGMATNPTLHSSQSMPAVGAGGIFGSQNNQSLSSLAVPPILARNNPPPPQSSAPSSTASEADNSDDESSQTPLNSPSKEGGAHTDLGDA